MSEQYDKLGFTSEQINTLIDMRADWHTVEKLVKAGCPHSLVARII